MNHGIDSSTVRDNSKAENTYKKYTQIANRFRKWIETSEENSSWMQYLAPKLDDSDIFKCFRPPFPDELLDTYYTHISINEKKGRMACFSTIEGFQATIKHIYEVNEIAMPVSTKEKWVKYSKGFTNMRQKEFEEKGIPCYEGKTIMDNKGFEQLQTLSLDPKYTTDKQREFIPLNAKLKS